MVLSIMCVMIRGPYYFSLGSWVWIRGKLRITTDSYAAFYTVGNKVLGESSQRFGLGDGEYLRRNPSGCGFMVYCANLSPANK